MKRWKLTAMFMAAALTVSAPSAVLALPAAAEATVQQDSLSESEAREENAVRTLSFALSAVQDDEKTLTLKQSALDESFGEATTLWVSEKGKEYTKVKPDENGMLHLKLGGAQKCVYVEGSKQHVLWAGMLSGDGYDVQECEGYRAAAVEAPRAPVYAAVSEDENGDGSVELDLSALFEVFGEDLIVQVSPIDSSKHSKVEPDESGRYRIDMNGEDRYILISWKNMMCDFLWGGLVEAPAAKTAKTIAFRLFDDVSMTVDGFEDGRLQVHFADAGKVFSSADDMRLELAFEDEKGNVLARLTEALVDEDGASRVNENQYTTAYEGGVPKGAAMMKVALCFGDEAVYAHAIWFSEAAPTPAPEATSAPETTPEPKTPVPVLRLKDASATCSHSKVDFSGTVTVDGEVSGKWALYVDGEKCDLATFEDAGNGNYAFEVREYPCAEAPCALKICVWDAENDAIGSAEVSLQVEPPALVVSVQGYDGVYDGQPHAAEVSLSEAADVRYLYAVSASGDDKALQWQEEMPVFTDAGEWILNVRAEKEGYTFVYEGVEAGSEQDYAQAKIRIQAAPVEVRLWGRQIGEAVYDGKVQSVAFEYCAEVAEDETELFDLKKITEHSQWPQMGTVEPESADAGRYPIAFEEKRFAFAAQADSNFEISMVWDAEASYVMVEKANLAFVSESAYGLYGTFEGALKGEYVVQIEGEYARSDLYQGDVAAEGALSEAGTAYNEIAFTKSAAVEKLEQNYAFDLTANRGVIVVFPQSVSEADPSWESVRDEINPMAYAGLSRDALPGYYDGMQVALTACEGEYDGQPHEIQARFTHPNGAVMAMTEGVDYEVSFFREGALTQDLASAGVIEVRIAGKGNYCGTVTLDYEIVRQSVEGSVRIESWDYDGQAAGSAAHPVSAQPQPDCYVFRNAAGDEIDPPSEAGEYTVQAVWEDTQNVFGGASDAHFFRIRPAQAAVIVGQKDGEIVMEVIDDPSGLFDAETMVEYDGEEYRCTNENFEVEFDVSADVKAANAESRATLFIENWIYDGEAAGSARHEVQLTGADADAKIVFCDLDGSEIDPPSEAGRYQVTAIWGEPSVKKTAIFEIERREATVCAEDACKTFGESDPELIVQVDGTLPGDEIVYEAARQPGEDAGEYAVWLTGEAEQGSYRVKYEDAALTIERRSLEGAQVELTEGRATVRLDDGTELMEGTDYQIEIQDGEDDSAQKAVEVCGVGNYTGKIQALCQDVSLEATIQFLDSEGQAAVGVLTATKQGTMTFGVQVEMNLDFDADRLSLCVQGNPIGGSPKKTAEGVYRFDVADYAVSENISNMLAVQVSVDGEVRAERNLVWIRPRNNAPWIAAAVLMAMAALVSGAVCARLSRTLKKEKDKLLDEASRRSNRTIREGD